MNQHFTVHPWKVIRSKFDPKDQRFAESLMSLGNGAMGLRGNFEETYTSDSHRGTYIGGVWFPDKTRVGWWKNGYPHYFGKVINAMNLIGIKATVNGEEVDASSMIVNSFYQELDMRQGVLRRQMQLATKEGSISIQAERFVSMNDKNLLCLRWQISASYAAQVELTTFLDGDVHNEDSNYDEQFWQQLDAGTCKEEPGAYLLTRTRENPFGTPQFTVAAAFQAQSTLPYDCRESAAGYAAVRFSGKIGVDEPAILTKYVCLATDRDHAVDQLLPLAIKGAENACAAGYQQAMQAQIAAWEQKWQVADVVIAGDDAAQQGIRFNLFHLLSTYTGEDARLNIGPKGFTGEKYGGATYWDTEAYCFPVYLAIAGEDVAKQLLHYRHRQLPGAYHNAKQQGLPGALYPMVTFNGIECHNEWEITFMELHRNGAIAHAIWNYTTYTGDETYLLKEGLDVLLGIARFWAGRVHYNTRTECYMIHGVTGPNEYENNVNNNWYTNRIAAWCLTFFLETYAKASVERQDELAINQSERQQMADIAARMYEPRGEGLDIFVQHDTFLDKVLMLAEDLLPEDRPLNQHWSWDRILRSCFIKQADVLQGLYFLGHLYDTDTKRKNFDFYEPMTVHESSLSPCVHSILAAEVGYPQKAVELYHRTARLDLDNINRDTQDGLHVTSMAGAWLSIVQGFAGMRTATGLSFAPFLPEGWTGYSFRFQYRGRVMNLSMDQEVLTIQLISGTPLEMTIWNQNIMLSKEWKGSRKQP